MHRNYSPSIGLLSLVILIIFTASADCRAQKYMPAPDNYADLGNPEDEKFHNLRGWSGLNSPLPKAYGTDRTSRYQSLRGANSVKLFISQLGIPYNLTFRGEAGMCDDSFEIYVNNSGPLYAYKNKESANLTSFHQIKIDTALITDTTVEVTFRNIAEDSCGFAAISFVALEPLSNAFKPGQDLLQAPRIALERALQLAADYAEAEKIALTDYTLSEAKLVDCNEDDRCWKLRWGRVNAAPDEYVEFKVSMEGVVSYRLSR